MNGPFANPNDLTSGFWIIDVPSKEKAIEWAKRIPFKNGTVEIRPIQELSDFPPEIQEAAQGLST